MISSWVKILPHGAGLPLPEYGTPMAAGMDFLAAVEKNLILKPGETTLVPTGLAVAFPEGFELQIRPRSGLALNHGITIPNAPGTIDADYRGEIKIILHNGGRTPFTIRRGDRIAQGVLARYERIVWKETDHLPETSRGHGGFGSTGI